MYHSKKMYCTANNCLVHHSEDIVMYAGSFLSKSLGYAGMIHQTPIGVRQSDVVARTR
jgi:hypothetical protein